jgi:hypothetical protein
MANFINIERSWNIIAHRPIKSEDGYHLQSSWKGRGVCLIHTLATPLKAISGVGLLVITAASIMLVPFGVITLNISPKSLITTSFHIVDLTLGAVLLPIALAANVIRGIVGTVIHPGAMIKEDDSIKTLYKEKQFPIQHPILQGTLVNYLVK